MDVKLGFYYVQIKRVDGEGRALYENQKLDGKSGIMMCKLKGGWIREGIMM